MYFYRINVFWSDSDFIKDLISAKLVSTEIPTPRLVFSPGFTIQMFFYLRLPSRASSFEFKFAMISVLSLCSVFYVDAWLII